MNAQEIFDKAYLGVIAQGGPSWTQDRGCRYRNIVGGETRACGVGHLLDDETALRFDRKEDPYIKRIIEDGDVDDVPAWMEENIHLLIAIQDKHDTAALEAADGDRTRAEFDAFFLTQWKTLMASVAQERGLRVPETPV